MAIVNKLWIGAVVLLLSFSGVGPGCSPEGDGDADGDSDGDSDGDGDGDSDGDGDADACIDEDSDGYGENCDDGEDCDDSEDSIHPGADEECNGVDDDCDGTTDEDLGGPSCPLTDGVCIGAVQSCDGSGGWADCGSDEYGADFEEVETLCDGLDNDCDGSVDEGECECAPGETQSCGVDEGECVAGTQSCTDAGIFGPCEGEVGPMGETCNGLDDDCDTDTDEETDLTPQDCPLQDGVCAGSQRLCQGADGWGDCAATGSYGDDYEIDETSCDGLDNDCDNIIDEGCDCIDGTTQDCGSGVGACEEGTQTCVSGAYGACAGEIGPEDEICDGIDNDCDTDTDEELVGPDCALTEGVCAGSSQPCDGASGFGACTAAEYGPRYEETESTCDGFDNDCDSETDEGCDCVHDATQPCGSSTGVCEPGEQTCDSGSWGDCTGGIVASDEICNGLDDDCDTETDDGLTAPACALTLGVCQGSVQECGGESGWTACAGTDSYGLLFVADEDGATNDIVCDGLDNDCDDEVDEGCTSGPIVAFIEDIYYPSVYGNHIVFLGDIDDGSGTLNTEVYFHDLRTNETWRLTDSPENEDRPQVHGNQVVYARGEGVDSRVYLYDLETNVETELASVESAQPRINQGYVVYSRVSDGAGDNSDVYGYDILSDTTEALITGPANDWDPDIRIPYMAYSTDEVGVSIVHLVDLTTGDDTATTSSATANQSFPRVDFLDFAWVDARNVSDLDDPLDNWEIYGATITEITTELAVEAAAQSQILNDAHGQYYVWMDSRNGNWDVSMSYIGGEEFFLTTNDSFQGDPAICGNLVLWEDLRLGSFDIYGSVFTAAVAEVGDITINEVLADPPDGSDANGDGVSNVVNDEFVEITNVTAMALDISGFTISDSIEVRHTFPAGTVLQAGGAIVVFGGGTPTGLFGGATVMVADDGSLGLNNGDDTVTLSDASGTEVDSVAYDNPMAIDTSIVRVPEYTGVFVDHDSDPDSGGRAFSPGLLRIGYAF